MTEKLLRFNLCFLGLLLLTFTTAFSFGQVQPQVIVPSFDDDFSKTVQQLENGQTDIDYLAFRYSFIESEQFRVASGKMRELDSLKKAMYSQMEKSAYSDIISTTKQMLSIDYTNMLAHKILRQTYKIVGDTINAAKYKTIQFGLLNSIVKNGDGQTCATAWPVIQVDEEYFILTMIDAQLLEQSITEEKRHLCDQMNVKVDGKKKTFYFETSKVFEGYKKLGL
ncbi:MAG: DUF4919 domain-containing protein [Cryomorphaceae bacterium]|nr:DUF4919 domain-containing protein [Cryomorphaceae bacterium]